jgi:V8-like Glu-specific endopeptidase/N-acetyl-anhydromuramyl-L-alanine amidase AmpD
MRALIRANRLDVTDRFPMLGYTIRTDGTPQRAEVVLTTNPELLLAKNKSLRTTGTFFSTRGGPPLLVPRGEAVFIVPPDLMVRFAGQPKLFVALATIADRPGAVAEVAILPDSNSPYVSLSGLTGRGLRRVRMLPTRQQRAAGYGGNGDGQLEWAGDTAAPGTEKAEQPKTEAAPAMKPGSNGQKSDRHAVEYDDGFGPLPASNGKTPRPAAAPAAAQSVENGSGDPGIEGPIPDLPGPAVPAGLALEAETPEYPRASRFVPAHSGNYRGPKGERWVERIVIHITDGGPNIAGPIGWFQNPDAHVSAHYIVGRDGEVVQMVRHNMVAYHASSANETSIGIEHVANTRGLNPTEQELDASAALVAWLCAECGIPIDREHVLGHAEADTRTSHRGCPNAVWNWDDYMARVTSAAAMPTSQALAVGRRGVLSRAQEIVQPFYEPSDPASALRCQNDAFSQAREEWFVGVPDTTIFPHSAICLLEMKDASGSVTSRGTGFYIGPNRILTCAHNLHDQSSVDVIPGKNDSAEPFGRFNVTNASWRVSNRYPRDGHRFDLAVIDNVPTAAPGGLFFDFLRATPSTQMEVVVCGYSSRSELVPELTQAINGRKQHLHAGYVASVNGETFDYPILTLKRASGSPVYHIAADSSGALQAYVIGVHVSGEPAAQGLNRGCFLTPDKLDWIEGRTTSLGVRPRARALDIPLDPGAGGQSIGVDALAPADIIVSTARHPVSYAIRGGTLSAVSHVMLYVGDGKVVEAVGGGVREIAIEDAASDAILAVAYRDPRVTGAIASAIVAHARSRVGDPYNYAGAAFSGYRILNPLPGGIIEAIASRLGLEVGQAGATYCSELVLEAYERAGVPLTATLPGSSTPEEIVQLRRTALQYVGHLKAEDVPLGIPLGAGLSRARTLEVANTTVGAERTAVMPPTVSRMGTAQRAAFEAALLAFGGPLAPLIGTARAAAPAAGVSIGIGPAVGAGLGAGGGLGAGVIFGPDGGIGVYGAAEVEIGFLASISATVQVTVVRGGIESFNGWGLAAVISGGEGVVGGAAALFDLSGTFQGVSVQLGVGVGASPVDFYVAIQRQVATQLSVSLARTMGADLPVPVIAASKRVVAGSVEGASWQLEHLDGMRMPAQPAAAAIGGERRVSLDDWPYLDAATGPVRLPLALLWRYRGGAIGDVRFEVQPAQTQPGCTLTVTAELSDGPDTPAQLAQHVTVRHRFTAAGRPDVGAVSSLTLYGDGTYERQDRWEQPLQPAVAAA